MKSYELTEHTADFCLCVKADTVEGLFEAAAQGLLDNICLKAETADACKKESFEISASSPEELLVKFLNELVYMFYIRKMLPKDNLCRINLYGNALKTEADFVNVKSFSANFEIKAVTYGGIKIEKKNNLYGVTVIADV
jgi:SHS2 domain-containing protein